MADFLRLRRASPAQHGHELGLRGRSSPRRVDLAADVGAVVRFRTIGCNGPFPDLRRGRVHILPGRFASAPQQARPHRGFSGCGSGKVCAAVSQPAADYSHWQRRPDLHLSCNFVRAALARFASCQARRSARLSLAVLPERGQRSSVFGWLARQGLRKHRAFNTGRRHLAVDPRQRRATFRIPGIAVPVFTGVSGRYAACSGGGRLCLL